MRPLLAFVLLSLLAVIPSVSADSGSVFPIGDQIAVMWMRWAGPESRLLMQRFDDAGRSLNEPVTIVTGRVSQFRAASDGVNLFVIWFEGDPFSTSASVAAALVAPDDRVTKLESVGSATTNRTASAAPDVAWDGGQYVVAWSDGSGPPFHLVTADRNGRVTRAIGFSGESAFLKAVAVIPGFERHLLVVSGWHFVHDRHGESVLYVLSFARDLSDVRRTQIDAISGQYNSGCSASRWMFSPSGVFSGTGFVVTWFASDCRKGTSARYAELSVDGTIQAKIHFTEIPEHFGSSWLSSMRPYLTPDGILIVTGGTEVLRRVSDAPLFRTVPFPPGFGAVALLPDGRFVTVRFLPDENGINAAAEVAFVPAPLVPGRFLRR